MRRVVKMGRDQFRRARVCASIGTHVSIKKTSEREMEIGARPIVFGSRAF